MKIETIREMQHRAPFRPFNLHLTTGEVLRCEHPEQMALDLKDGVLSLFTSEAPHWNLIEAESVKRLSTEKRKAKAQTEAATK